MNKIFKYFIFIFVLTLLAGGLTSFMIPRTPDAIPATPNQNKEIAAPQFTPADTVELDEEVKEPVVTVKLLAANSTEVATNTVEPELAEAQKELAQLNELLAENAKVLYTEFMEVQNLSKLGIAALEEVTPLKKHISRLRKALIEVNDQLEGAGQTQRMDSLHERLNVIKKTMTQAKDLLKEKEAKVAEYQKAYDKANTAKFKTQRERLEHRAWKNELQKQINELTPERSETE